MQGVYRGRFAPSPTGPLHFGSLVTAVASYMEARSQKGQWLVRIEDVDTTRTEPGAADQILRTLESYGFEWDGPVLFQTTRLDAYEQALDQLRQSGFAFPCACSRQQVGDVYPGTCRNGLPPGRQARSMRMRVTQNPIQFQDQLQGHQTEQLEHTSGDFIIKRADGLFAYQLAVVVDDQWHEITNVVRGSDLLSSTFRQLLLQRALNFSHPTYMHLPVAIDNYGDKLSKQTKASPLPLDQNQIPATLAKAFKFLGHTPSESFPDVRSAWHWITKAWSPANLPAVRERSLPHA